MARGGPVEGAADREHPAAQTHTPAAPPPNDAELMELARRFVGQGRGPRTRRAYDGDWRRVTAWCAERTDPRPDFYFTLAAASSAAAVIALPHQSHGSS